MKEMRVCFTCQKHVSYNSRESVYVLEQASAGGHDISFFNRDIGCYKTDTGKQEESYSLTINKVKFKSGHKINNKISNNLCQVLKKER